MKQLLSVLNTNTIMKNGMRIMPCALVDGVWQRCITGVPMMVSHDHSRVVGWTFPFAVHFEPGIARSVSLTHLFESEEEARVIESQRLHFYGSLITQKQYVVERLKQQLAKYLSGHEKVVHSPQVALFEQDLAARAFSEIFELADKDRDGLIPLERLKPIGPGVYQVGEFAIFAHEYFRRALFRLNTLNAEFLSHLQSLDKELKARVALDWDMVGLASDFALPVELMYSWGPKFDNDLSKIKHGVTVHTSDNDSDRFFSGVNSTEFWWKHNKGEYTFEVEEIVDRDHPYYKDEMQFGCRFVCSDPKKLDTKSA